MQYAVLPCEPAGAERIMSVPSLAVLHVLRQGLYDIAPSGAML
jgi:hypothetical protein